MKRYFLWFIVLLFLFTRLYKINQIPSSVYWDEASIGYNAYSVLKTGSDEWGEFLPLHFRAFGEFKLPLYIYSAVPFIALFGLNEFSVRLPSVIYSFVAVILVYLITKKLTNSNTIGLYALFLSIISPWTFIFSRTGYEATAGLAFYLLGIFFSLSSWGNSKYFLLVVLSWIASIYNYNSFRVIVPISILFIFALQLIKEKANIIKNKYLIISFLVFVISLLPITKLYFQDYGGSRLQAIGLEGDTFKDKIFYFGNNYMSHFNPTFLFVDGDSNPRSQIPGFGQLYLMESVLVVVGIYTTFKKKGRYFLPFALLLVAPIPAAITRESPHALRAILMAPSFSIISAIGAGALLVKKNYPKYIHFVLIFTLFLSFLVYFQKFLTDYNKTTSLDWQYPYKQVFSESINFEEFNEVHVADTYGQPYIFTLFYNKYDPESFWNEVNYNPPDKWGVSTVESFGKYKFISNENVELEENSLLIIPPDINIDYKQVKTISDLKGEEAFIIYKNE